MGGHQTLLVSTCWFTLNRDIYAHFGNHVVSVGRGVDLVNKCDPKTYAPKGPFFLRRKATSMRAGKGRHISLMMPKKAKV